MGEPAIETAGTVEVPSHPWAARRSLDALVPVALAPLFVAGAWLIGGQQGFDRVGIGIENLQLLPNIGDPAPDSVVPTVDGQAIRLSDLRGQPVWLNFRGNWCPPCRSEFPIHGPHVRHLPECHACRDTDAARGIYAASDADGHRSVLRRRHRSRHTDTGSTRVGRISVWTHHERQRRQQCPHPQLRPHGVGCSVCCSPGRSLPQLGSSVIGRALPPLASGA